MDLTTVAMFCSQSVTMQSLTLLELVWKTLSSQVMTKKICYNSITLMHQLQMNLENV